MPATPPWLAAAEALFNRNIDASSRASQLAQRLDGTSLQIDVTGLTQMRVQVQGRRLSLLAGDDSPADAVISGPPAALWSLLRTAAAAGAPVGSAAPAGRERVAVQVRGNAEIANLYKEFFAAESYHQGYFRRNPTQGYCRAVVSPKVAKFRAKWASRLKA